MTALARMRPLARWAAILAAGLWLASCGTRPERARISYEWIVGRTEPLFDPDGPPEPVRWALERLLSRGLVERDSAGVIHRALADSIETSADGLTWTFHLIPDVHFTDGTPLRSTDFVAALTGGLARQDHATRNWLLAALQGVDQVRAGRPLPELGLETPNARTLVLRLAQRDSLLLEKLALPGVSTPFRKRTPGTPWSDAIGLGPYRVRAAAPGRELTLVAAGNEALGVRATADTLRVRFVIGGPRARTAMRQGRADLVWPAPPTLLDQAAPAGYVVTTRAAEPVRRLLLVLRADVPPTTKTAARHALAHSLDRRELLEALGPRASANGTGAWLPGAGPFEFPALDGEETRAWLARGKLGASFHVSVAFDADGAGAEVARLLQGQWARLGLYAEMKPLRGAAALAEALAPRAAQAQLVECQAPLAGAAAELATLVMPLRGPAIGSFRTGWRTREFDAWIARARPAGPWDPTGPQVRLAEELIALPLADMPWLWLERTTGTGARFHPRYGPEFTTPTGN